MAIEDQVVGDAASRLLQSVRDDHGDHPDPSISTVGVIVAVAYEDPETGESRTRTHYRFEHAPEFDECPAYIALGLTTQVANHMGQ
jgi:hypothetical protein